MSIASGLDRWAAEAPSKVVLRAADGDLAYAELNRWSSGIASQLGALGVRRGDRVGILAGSNAALVAVMYGAWKLGAVAVLLNPQLAVEDLGRQALHAEASVIIADEDPARWDKARAAGRLAGGAQVVRPAPASTAVPAVPAVDVEPDALAVIAYTSGTTGTAKGVAHTHGAMLTQVEMAAVHFSATSQDELLALLPLFLLTIFMVGPMLAVSLGASCRVVAPYNPLDVVRSIEKDRTTMAAAVPLFFYDLRELASSAGSDFDLSSLRVITSGGAPLPEDIRDDLERRFGFRLVQLYGMTEAPGIVTSDPMEGGRKTGSVGLALPHIRVTVEDEEGRELPPGAVGEVCASAVKDGPYAGRYTTMASYWGNPEQTAEALRGGRLHTGDVGYLDEDGFLYLVDRKKDIIIRGGMNIYPREMERLLSEDARVDECVVVGAPHPRYGEVPVAFVRLRPGTQAAADELLSLANSRLPGSQRLQSVHVVADFPRNSLGKVVRRQLTGPASSDASSEGAAGE